MVYIKEGLELNVRGAGPRASAVLERLGYKSEGGYVAKAKKANVAKERTENERTDTSVNGASRKDLMDAVQRLGVKNFRVMNKAELLMIVNGATPVQIEAIQLAAVTRWKSGWSKNKK